VPPYPSELSWAQCTTATWRLCGGIKEWLNSRQLGLPPPRAPRRRDDGSASAAGGNLPPRRGPRGRPTLHPDRPAALPQGAAAPCVSQVLG
jgi:hypothetical protein